MASIPLAMSFCADVYEYEYIFLQLLVRKIYFKTLSIKLYVCLHKVKKICFPKRGENYERGWELQFMWVNLAFIGWVAPAVVAFMRQL